MKVQKGDYVIFQLDTDKQKEGIVLNISMGMLDVMTTDGSYTIRMSEVAENKGNVFELMKEKKG